MRKLLFAVACFGVMLVPAFGSGGSEFTTYNLTLTDGSLESGWVCQIPSGAQDYFNVRFDGLMGRPVNGVSVGSGDFGAGTSYPMAGLFDANTAVDPAGNTPNLAVGMSAGRVLAGTTIFNYVYAPFGMTYNPATEPQHVVAQFPAADPGLLGIGQDDATHSPVLSWSGFTTTGYTTPAAGPLADTGMHPNIDICQEIAGGGAGVIAWYVENTAIDLTGDMSLANTQAGGYVGLAVFGPSAGHRWMLFLSFLGAPFQKVTGVIPLFADAPCGYFRAGMTWPIGFPNLTLTFVAVFGTTFVTGVSNEVTLMSGPDPSCNWGVKDDGGWEWGVAIQKPNGPMDFMNTNFTCYSNPGVNNVTDIKIFVFDFGSSASVFPVSGVYESNKGIDPSGNTPNLGIVYDSAPFTYPLVAGGSSLWHTRTFTAAVPYASFPDNDVHGLFQHLPGEPGNLWIGSDSNSTIVPASYFSTTGYTTAAVQWSPMHFGIRLGSN